MFPVTITLQNADQLNAVLAALALKDPEITDTTKKSTTARSSTRTRTASDSSASSSTGSSEAGAQAKGADAGNAQPDAAAQTGASAATGTTAQSAETGAAVTYQAAADAVTKLARTKGRDAAIGVLKSFGVEKLPEVKADQYAAVVDACAAAMEG